MSLRSSLLDHAPVGNPALADEAIAMRAVLHTAHERARALAAQLELEAEDPRVRTLFQRTREIQRDIARLVVDLTANGARHQRSPMRGLQSDRDCRECLTSVESCEAIRSAGAGPCCGECSHG